MPIDDSNAPPRKRKSNTPHTPSITNASNVNKYEEGLTGLLQIVSAIAVGTGNLADAGAISQHGPRVAHETAVLGSKSEPVAKVLNYLTTVTPYTALIAAVMPLAAQIAVNHKLVKPGGAIGTVSPEALEALMQAQMLESEQYALRMQQEAEEQLRLMRVDMEQGVKASQHLNRNDGDVNPDETY